MLDSSVGEGPIDLTVLLPAFNEAQALAQVIADVRTALGERELPWEILVIDDGSSDATASIATQAGVRVIRRTERGGYGATVKRGLVESRGQWVALLDADGSYPPAQLPPLLAHIPEYEQVNGARQSERGTQPWLRALAKGAIRRLAQWISGRTIPDLNTGMKVLNREIAMQYLWVIPQGFSCSTSLTLAYLCNGHAVKYVPIEYRPRLGHSKFHPFYDTAQYCLTILRIMTYFRPLRVFLPLSLALGGAALVKGLYDVWRFDSGLSDSDVILATGAVLVFALGLLADLIVTRGGGSRG
ncbi:MAG: glycosyltransferase family 2 protein [Planctomycetales bacterium]